MLRKAWTRILCLVMPCVMALSFSLVFTQRASASDPVTPTVLCYETSAGKYVCQWIVNNVPIRVTGTSIGQAQWNALARMGLTEYSPVNFVTTTAAEANQAYAAAIAAQEAASAAAASEAAAAQAAAAEAEVAAGSGFATELLCYGGGAVIFAACGYMIWDMMNSPPPSWMRPPSPPTGSTYACEADGLSGATGATGATGRAGATGSKPPEYHCEMDGVELDTTTTSAAPMPPPSTTPSTTTTVPTPPAPTTPSTTTPPATTMPTPMPTTSG
jgi:hypothetical protein